MWTTLPLCLALSAEHANWNQVRVETKISGDCSHPIKWNSITITLFVINFLWNLIVKNEKSHWWSDVVVLVSHYGPPAIQCLIFQQLWRGEWFQREFRQPELTSKQEAQARCQGFYHYDPQFILEPITVFGSWWPQQLCPTYFPSSSLDLCHVCSP